MSLVMFGKHYDIVRDDGSTPQMVHHLTMNQVEMLEETHAYLTEEGWQVPAWITELRNSIKGL